MSEPGTIPSIDAVLEAEHDAELQVAKASREADAVVAEARASARRVARRADERVRRVHERAAQMAEERIASLRADYHDRQRASQRTLADDDLLNEAVRRVVDWLLGSDKEGGAP